MHAASRAHPVRTRITKHAGGGREGAGREVVPADLGGWARMETTQICPRERRRILAQGGFGALGVCGSARGEGGVGSTNPAVSGVAREPWRNGGDQLLSAMFLAAIRADEPGSGARRGRMRCRRPCAACHAVARVAGGKRLERIAGALTPSRSSCRRYIGRD